MQLVTSLMWNWVKSRSHCGRCRKALHEAIVNKRVDLNDGIHVQCGDERRRSDDNK